MLDLAIERLLGSRENQTGILLPTRIDDHLRALHIDLMCQIRILLTEGCRRIRSRVETEIEFRRLQEFLHTLGIRQIRILSRHADPVKFVTVQHPAVACQISIGACHQNCFHFLGLLSRTCAFFNVTLPALQGITTLDSALRGNASPFQITSVSSPMLERTK